VKIASVFCQKAEICLKTARLRGKKRDFAPKISHKGTKATKHTKGRGKKADFSPALHGGFDYAQPPHLELCKSTRSLSVVEMSGIDKEHGERQENHIFCNNAVIIPLFFIFVSCNFYFFCNLIMCSTLRFYYFRLYYFQNTFLIIYF